MEDDVAGTIQQERLTATLASTVGFFALAIAVTGIYGVTYMSAEQRRKEFGIRMALGAPRWRVFQSSLVGIGAAVLFGCGLGVPASIAFARVLRESLYGVSSEPLSVLFYAVGLLLVVSFTAAGIPVRSLLRSNPINALKEE